ncbi:hypothetical protein [Streptomyces sp. NPDC052012]|uniref:hypothetical protein n=1 Tax=Streptomyces sp. NPDC052012 TaxID=3155051 RepID=UPI00344F2D14
MVFGIPGLSAVLYILSVLAMPVTELARAITGRRTGRRWRVIVRHAALVAVITTCVWLVSAGHPAIDALRPGGTLHDVYQWALRTSIVLMALLALVPWLVRAVRRACRHLGWICAHTRHPHPARPHPSVLAIVCPDCGRLSFQVQQA